LPSCTYLYFDACIVFLTDGGSTAWLQAYAKWRYVAGLAMRSVLRTSAIASPFHSTSPFI